MMRIIKALKCCHNLYQVVHALGLFSNDDPGLTLTIYMTGSKLFPDASVWVTAYTTLSGHFFKVCYN